ncbi:MAG: lipopolysaccharide heptosyltransferase II [Capsulimonadales bacterium]|nr:lipopolysaccharide heptosyltransferase II [Capsulimonadales bacterium]
MRLLAVNLNYLGDALFTTPALAALKERYPQATLDVLAGERATAILRGNVSIDRLITRPPRDGMGRALHLRNTLQEGRYDAVVLFQSTLTNALVSFLERVPIRIGFQQAGCSPFLTHTVPSRRSQEHDVDAYCRLAHAVEDDTVPFPHRLSIAVSPADNAFADAFLHNREVAPPVVGLVIGATRPQKRWPEEYFVRLADRLWSAAGVCSVLLGGPEETDAAQRILAQVRSPLVSAVGLTTEKQLAALVGRLSVVVSGDSGPLHIATAMNTPVVAIFGSTDPVQTGPWICPRGEAAPAIVLYDGFACSPCRKNPTCHGRYDCLKAITPERVYESTCGLLGVLAHRTALPVIATGAKGVELP